MQMTSDRTNGNRQMQYLCLACCPAALHKHTHIINSGRNKMAVNRQVTVQGMDV